MRKISYHFVCTLVLSLIAARIAAAQSDTPKISPATGSAAETNARPKPDAPSVNTADKSDNPDKGKETPAAPAKPAPVKYTELKKTAWPPKSGSEDARSADSDNQPEAGSRDFIAGSPRVLSYLQRIRF